MKYEFHVGDYVEMMGGFVGWVRQIREGLIWVAYKDINSCSFRIPKDLDCFKRIGQYDFTKKNDGEIEPLDDGEIEPLDEEYTKSFTLGVIGRKINELVEAVNRLEEKVNET